VTDWTDAHVAHGPTLADWCVRHGLTAGEGKHSSFARRVCAWTHGENPSIACVDRWLTSKGYHLSELPDEVWAEAPAPYAEPSEIAELLDRHLPVREIARRVGRAPATVRYHRDRRATV
jgi:hypothetical protein